LSGNSSSRQESHVAGVVEADGCSWNKLALGQVDQQRWGPAIADINTWFCPGTLEVRHIPLIINDGPATDWGISDLRYLVSVFAKRTRLTGALGNPCRSESNGSRLVNTRPVESRRKKGIQAG